MYISNYISGISIVDTMQELWGDNLQELNLSEKMWLVRAALGSYCDFEKANNVEMDETVVKAENDLLYLEIEFYLQVTFSFLQYLQEGAKPLGFYLSSTDEAEQEWVANAEAAWGSHLEYIPHNDSLIFLFNTSTELIDFDNLPHLDEMHDWLEGFKELDDSDADTLIVAIVSLAHDSYFYH